MPHDPYDRQQAIREQVRDFAEKEIKPYSEYWDKMPEPRKFPFEIYRKMGQAGFLGLNTPVEYGGQGKSDLEFITVIEELAYADGAFGLICEIGRLVAYPILTWGTPEQRDKYVADCISGEKVVAFALTEPGAGSDAAAMQTSAFEKHGRFILNGEKTFITHGDVAELALVFCKIEGQQKISAIMVDTNQSGWKARTLKYKMGIRATTTAHISLENVTTPENCLIGETGQGFKYAMITLDSARVCVAAQAIGLARRALDETVQYAISRIAFGAPIAKLQAIQFMIADMATRLEAARLLTYRAAQLMDVGQRYTLEAAQAKLYATETAGFCVDRAMQIHAGHGYIGEFSVIEKLYRDQRFLEIGEGTSEIQRMVIAASLLR